MSKAILKQLAIGVAASLVTTALLFRVPKLEQLVTGTTNN